VWRGYAAARNDETEAAGELLTVVRIVAVSLILAGCAASSSGSLEPGTVQVRLNGDIHNGVSAGTSSIK
jgi:hypothetical protein